MLMTPRMWIHVLKPHIPLSMLLVCRAVCRAWREEIGWSSFRAACLRLGRHKRLKDEKDKVISWLETFKRLCQSADLVRIKMKNKRKEANLFFLKERIVLVVGIVRIFNVGTEFGSVTEREILFKTGFCKKRRARRVAKLCLSQLEDNESHVFVFKARADLSLDDAHFCKVFYR